MYSLKDYFDNGHISRIKVASDIISCKLTREDLDELVKNEDVKSVFIGRNFKCESDPKKWTKEYLEKLSYMAIGESFNEEYLFHLCDVAEHVNQPKENSKLIGIILITATIATLGRAIYIWINTKMGS